MTTAWQRMLGICTKSLGTIAITSAAFAQTPCNSPGGPDVIVGDLTGPANYVVANGMDALSLGTTSCNVGNQNLSWSAPTPNHPVIGGNLYRLKNAGGYSRLEQVGLSWLKHGFFALTQNLCCTCNGQGNQVLGVGCADPYTAGRNGDQVGNNGLGPRWQVNANLGTNVFPHPTSGTNGNAGRIEVLLADLEATNANTHYYGESQYIAADDAAAGNQNNNASYRRVNTSISGGNWSFTFSGTTAREQPAINAWKAFDPTVTLNNVQVPGEGLFILGHKVTNLGNGTWHYEYLLYNMNSDRSGQSFALPIPANVVVTNVGFHDVTYRHNDGINNVTFDGTDWATQYVGGIQSWATSTHAQNANANALRWGTGYNFRFDANTGPVAGVATIGLFKPGSPTSVTSPVEVPGAEIPPISFCVPQQDIVNDCPCFNTEFQQADAGHGCGNSVFTGGALLDWTGSASPDTLQFTVTDIPAGVGTIYLQGDVNLVTTTGPVQFGDGIRCAGGTLLRLGLKNDDDNDNSTTLGPASGDAQISVLGGTLPGSTYVYQTYYRNPNPTWCPPLTFNVTQALQIQF